MIIFLNNLFVQYFFVQYLFTFSCTFVPIYSQYFPYLITYLQFFTFS